MIPTLLVPGSIKVYGTSISPDTVPIDYIIGWLRSRMPEFNSTPPELSDRILIIRSETGSGKSTVIPVAIFRILKDQESKDNYIGGSVICTQPRVLTAVALANDVSSREWNPDIILGVTVGYHTGPLAEKPKTGLIYASAGVLATQLRNFEDIKIMESYRFILLDEAHERSIDNDILLMLLVNFYRRNIGHRLLPFLILTSATYDPHKYAKYFGVSESNIIEVVGRTYPIEIHWPEKSSIDYTKDSALTAIKIHEENKSDTPKECDILIFVPGAEETKSISNSLIKHLKFKSTSADFNPFYIIIINREVVVEKREGFSFIFAPPDKLPLVMGKHPTRRIIISTSVAETGLTIDTLKYVIDAGWSRSMERYFPSFSTGLISRPAAQSRIKQRMGRAGRLFPGHFYPLMLKESYDALDSQQMPDIITMGMHEYHISMIAEQLRQKIQTKVQPAEFCIEDLELLDLPPTDSFIYSNTIAMELGFISMNSNLPTQWPPLEYIETREIPDLQNKGYGLTPTGYIAASFSHINMEGAKLLLSTFVLDVAMSDAITIVAMFGYTMETLLKRDYGSTELPQVSKILKDAMPSFVVHKTGGATDKFSKIKMIEDEEYYFRAKLLIADDYIETILIYNKFVSVLHEYGPDISSVIKWCKKRELKFSSMMEIVGRRDSIISDLMRSGINPYSNHENRINKCKSMEDFISKIKAIKNCIYSGLKSHLLTLSDDNVNYISINGLKVRAPALFGGKAWIKLRSLDPSPGINMYRPKWIITDNIILKTQIVPGGENISPLLWIPSTSMISVIDGFVNPDTEFNAAGNFFTSI